MSVMWGMLATWELGFTERFLEAELPQTGLVHVKIYLVENVIS